MRLARSYLYVPGDQADRLAGAAGRGADALIIDLEDAVALGAKTTARDTVASWLRERPAEGPDVWVRVNNSGELLEDDVRMVAGSRGVAGISVPKATEAALHAVNELLTGTDLAILALVETAGSVLALEAIARAPRVALLALGEADLSADLGLEPTLDQRELLPLRLHVVVVSAAAGLPAPVGPASMDFRDLEALRTSTLALRQLGFRSRSCIHPAQVAVIHDVFTPSREEVASARRVIELYDAAVASGVGACVDEKGRMVDNAVVRAARRTAATATDDQD